jgi:hypothetical protein
VPKLLRIEVQAAEMRRRLALVEPAGHGAFQDFRLLVDLLEHEVLEVSPVGVAGVPVELVDLGADLALIGAEDVKTLGIDGADLMVVQIDDAFRVTDESARVAGKIRFVLTQAKHQRTPQTCPDDLPRKVRADHRQAVGALQVTDGVPHRIDQVAVEVAGNQMSDDFGVGLTAELAAVGLELLFQDRVVLDDAIMDHGNRAVAGHVGMCVDVGGAAMGRPARVADARCSRRRLLGQELRKAGDAAGRFADAQVGAGHGGDAGAVVAPVFQPREAIQ